MMKRTAERCWGWSVKGSATCRYLLAPFNSYRKRVSVLGVKRVQLDLHPRSVQVLRQDAWAERLSGELQRNSHVIKSTPREAVRLAWKM
jgi:hypothetical protein